MASRVSYCRRHRPLSGVRTVDRSQRSRRGCRSGQFAMLVAFARSRCCTGREQNAAENRGLCGARRCTARSRGSIASQLEAFQAGMRKRYSDEQILEELKACAERLGRSPTMREFEADPRDHGAPADGDRALPVVEPRQAPGRPGAAPVRHARGAAAAAARPGRRAGPRAHRQGHRGAQGLDAVEVALLAHLRVAQQRAQGGRVRRAGGGGAAGARDRPGRRPGRPRRAAAQVRGLGAGAARASRRC